LFKEEYWDSTLVALKNAEKAARHRLELLAQKLREAGFIIELRLEFGAPRRVIPQIANEEGFQLLVIGRKVKSGEIRDVLFEKVSKQECLCRFGDISEDLYFVVDGLLRAYILDEEGHEYNKNFFIENTFAGSMVSLLTKEPSYFEIEALEDSMVIAIDYEKFRALLLEAEDLKLFQIYYLEQNWLIEKESREIALVQQNADERYRTFLEKYPNLENRIPQYLIASHLGITPTQLSRIRKNLK